jgi:hypothetical protein
MRMMMMQNIPLIAIPMQTNQAKRKNRLRRKLDQGRASQLKCMGLLTKKAISNPRS